MGDIPKGNHRDIVHAILPKYLHDEEMKDLYDKYWLTNAEICSLDPT